MASISVHYNTLCTIYAKSKTIPIWATVIMVTFARLEESTELQTKVGEDFTIMENTLTKAFFCLKAPTGTFTFKTLC